MLVIRADLVDGFFTPVFRGTTDVVVAGEKVQVVESYMFAHTGADDVPDHS